MGDGFPNPYITTLKRRVKEVGSVFDGGWEREEAVVVLVEAATHSTCTGGVGFRKHEFGETGFGNLPAGQLPPADYSRPKQVVASL